MESILSIKNLSKNFKSVNALKNVSLDIKPGEIFGLIGPDGAGKSTLIHIAAGLLSADKGSVSLLGCDVLKFPEKIKSVLGVLPQGLGLSLAAELSVEENIDYFAQINGVAPEKREELKNELLNATQLAPFKDRAAKNLSGGMKQKLGICCTLIHSPRVIFLDEPTTGVDPISRRDIWLLVNKIVKEQNVTIFLTTSYMDEAERCHRMALMHQGEIIAEGDINQLTQQFTGKLFEIQTDNQNKALGILKKMKNIKTIYPSGAKLNAVYFADKTEDEISSIKNYALQNNVKIEQIQQTTPTLEDVFFTKIMKETTNINQQALEEFFGAQDKDFSKNNSKDIMIEVKNIYKKFGRFTAVDNVSFSVAKGEIFAFLGPNGAGKTTTIKMLCGLFPPTSGSGEIGKFDIMREQQNIKKSIGYMSQKFSLYRDLTVGENIELYAGIYGVRPEELEERKKIILKIADLEGKDNIITDSLPMGIKQRLALGCAIIHKPRVIFLDEPTSGVDPVARKLFWDIIFFLSRRTGVTVLVTTHYMDEAELCDRLALINTGRLIAVGPPNELKASVSEQIGLMFEILTDSPFKALDVLSRQFKFCTIFGRRIHLYTKQPEKDKKIIEQILNENKIQVMDLRVKSMPFEDVFVYFCEKSEKGEN